MNANIEQVFTCQKCDVVCCHKTTSALSDAMKVSLRETIVLASKYLSYFFQSCLVCGQTDLSLIEFDHSVSNRKANGALDRVVLCRHHWIVNQFSSLSLSCAQVSVLPGSSRPRLPRRLIPVWH